MEEQVKALREEIESQRKYLNEAKAEKLEFAEFVSGVENIATGFSKIAAFLKSFDKNHTDRILGHAVRVSKLEDEINSLLNSDTSNA